MARKLRRRNEGKTDYPARLQMLHAGVPRLVVRKSNKYLLAQAVISREAQDTVVCGAHSDELISKGWSKDMHNSLKSVPAAYLTGFLLGTKIKKDHKDIQRLVVDLGIARSTKGSRLYAVVKGMIDAGFDVACSKEVIPSQDRIEGKHMKNKIDFAGIKAKIGA